MYIYAQLDISNICVGISQLKKDVPEYNYESNRQYNPITSELTEGESLFVSRMILVPVYSENYIGLRYNQGQWEQVITI